MRCLNLLLKPEMLTSEFLKGYEEALNRHAGQIGNKNTRVKSYECTRLSGQNSIRVKVKMDKQSCLTQSDVLVPALHNALDFSTNVPDHQCRRDINAGKC